MILTEEELITVYTVLAEEKGDENDTLRAILRATGIPSYNSKFSCIQDIVRYNSK